MSVTYKVTEKVVRGDVTVIAINTLIAGSMIAIDESMPVATDTPLAITLDVSQAKMVYMLSDRDIKIETNAVNAAGGNTIDLKANKPYRWYEGQYHALIFTADIAVAYVTNASGGAARLQIEILLDPTV